jgi:hypothetical protein
VIANAVELAAAMARSASRCPGGIPMSSRVVKVGDTVQFYVAKKPIIGQVREDRGPIGIGGRRLYRIVYELGKDCWYATELPAEKFEVVEPKPETA